MSFVDDFLECLSAHRPHMPCRGIPSDMSGTHVAPAKIISAQQSIGKILGDNARCHPGSRPMGRDELFFLSVPGYFSLRFRDSQLPPGFFFFDFRVSFHVIVL
jgi:hypothetical protein